MADGTINTGTVEFRMRENGVLHGVALRDRKQTIEDARENLAVARRITNSVQAPLLLDIRDTGTLTREAREHYAGPEGASVIHALAFVANSAFTRVVGNLFIRLARTSYPVRLFTDESRALAWLEEFLP